MVHTAPNGLGAFGGLYYDTMPKLFFADALFTKGTNWSDAYSKIQVPAAKACSWSLRLQPPEIAQPRQPRRRGAKR